jgi:hypothetical protein
MNTQLHNYEPFLHVIMKPGFAEMTNIIDESKHSSSRIILEINLF